MVLRQPWSTRRSTYEQIISALELKHHAVKEDVNEYWRLHAEFAGIAVTRREDYTV